VIVPRKPNYSFEKRRKELERKQKQEAKQQRRAEEARRSEEQPPVADDGVAPDPDPVNP
jgi:hypothetical protein